jgi:hypothetical protein
MQRIETIPPDSPLIRRATREEVEAQIIVINRKMNFRPDAEFNRLIAAELAGLGWTVSELRNAAALIPNDAELGKHARIAGATSTDVFALARKDVRIIAGRTLSVGDMLQLVTKHARGSIGWRRRISQEAFRTVRVLGESYNRYHLHRPEIILTMPA